MSEEEKKKRMHKVMLNMYNMTTGEYSIPYDGKFLYGCLGFNAKSTEMNAAFGLVQLDRLDEARTPPW